MRKNCTKPRCRRREYGDGLCAYHWDKRHKRQLREKQRVTRQNRQTHYVT